MSRASCKSRITVSQYLLTSVLADRVVYFTINTGQGALLIKPSLTLPIKICLFGRNLPWDKKTCSPRLTLFPGQSIIFSETSSVKNRPRHGGAPGSPITPQGVNPIFCLHRENKNPDKWFDPIPLPTLRQRTRHQGCLLFFGEVSLPGLL